MVLLYCGAAGVLAVVGATLAFYISWRSGWNEMSNRMVLFRSIEFALAMGGAIWLAGMGLAPDQLGRQIFGAGAAAVSVVILAYQSAFVATKRRQLVAAWQQGRELPRGVSQESVRAWAEKHGKA